MVRVTEEVKIIQFLLETVIMLPFKGGWTSLRVSPSSGSQKGKGYTSTTKTFGDGRVGVTDTSPLVGNVISSTGN